MNRRQKGFTLVEAIIVIVILAVIGLIAYRVVHSQNKKDGVHTAETQSPAIAGQTQTPVTWAYNQQQNKWFMQSGTAPKCREPFAFDSTPIDISQATFVMMPGAYRGFSYKPHGGFRLDNSPDGHIDVKLPIDATLVGLTRYYEGNPATLQYLLTFETDCGIAFRFDHLYKLTPAFEAIAQTTPEPKKDDTRTSSDDQPKPTRFKSGESVATEVGFPAVKNFGFDFGVYDYRQPNQISKNPEWAAIHNQYQAQEWFGVCWLNMLPGRDAARANELSAVSINPQKPNLLVSDYCPNAQHTTLDFNGGQPTDG